MSDFPLRQQIGEPPKKSRKKSCLFGCLGTIIGAPILLVIIGYYVIMHTAVPFRLVAGAIEQDGRVSIEGIGGSISKGFTIETLRAKDYKGNESILEGLTLKWGDINRMRKNNELVIEEIGLRRAHIFVDTSDTGSADDSTEEKSGTSTSSGEKLKLFEIKKVDIREVLIESTSGDFRLELDEILMEGFRIEGDEFDLASLSVGSNFIDIDLENAETDTINGEKIPFKRRIVGVVKPQLHESLLKEISFIVEMGAIGGEMVARYRIFDGAVEVIDLGKGEYESTIVKDFTPAEFFAEDQAGPLHGLSLHTRSGAPDPKSGKRPGLLESGSFKLGATLFTIPPQTLTEDAEKPDESPLPLDASTRIDEVTITATLAETERPPFLRVTLSSEPEREMNELIALLWFGKPLAQLTPDETAKVDAVQRTHFPSAP